MLWKEIVYMCMDKLKLSSDDSYYTPEHLMFLLSKFRVFILKLRYSDIRKLIPESNYQTICLDLELITSIQDTNCNNGVYLKSIHKIPTTIKIGNPTVYPIDFYLGDITYISRDRMRYVGHNKYLLNIIYCSKNPDGYLYFKSSNPQFLYLEKVRFNAIFEDTQEASLLECQDPNSEICDIMDKEFPIEDGLVPILLELVYKELLGPELSKKDDDNNAKDDLSKE